MPATMLSTRQKEIPALKRNQPRSMMSTSDTQNIVQQFLQHLTQRSLPDLVSLFSDEVDWYIPGDQSKAPWLGRRSTRQDIATCYQMLWEHVEPLSASIDHIFIDGNDAAITGEFSSRMLQTGKTVDSPFCIRITIEDGLITRYRLLEDSFAVSVALTDAATIEYEAVNA